MSIKIEVEINEKEIDVYVDGNVTGCDDSFSHEFGTEHIAPYQIVEVIEWKREKYTDTENEAIEKHI